VSDFRKQRAEHGACLLLLIRRQRNPYSIIALIEEFRLSPVKS
jgi:hypothetical protein